MCLLLLYLATGLANVRSGTGCEDLERQTHGHMLSRDLGTQDEDTTNTSSSQNTTSSQQPGVSRAKPHPGEA